MLPWNSQRASHAANNSRCALKDKNDENSVDRLKINNTSLSKKIRTACNANHYSN